jgi:hypothetical protein
MDEGDDIAFEAISARGNTIVTLSDEVVAELRSVGEDVTQRWIEEMDGLGLDGQQLVDDARMLVEQYSTDM